MMPRPTSLAWMFVALSAPVCLAAHPIPEAERWATITHPGNAAYQSDPSSIYGRPVGSVDYEYQISRTEVTGAEWFEFVQAYGRYIDTNHDNDTEFTSGAIVRTGPGTYILHPLAANRSIDVGWRYAARYCNWLHNGKADTPEAFERGVYDSSTFGDVFTPTSIGFTDQVAHSPDARYWLPTIDEWVKAAHFDPNRYGEGQPGYWTYSTSSDEPPIPGPVELGGQTSAAWPIFGALRPEVAAYRDVQSPWGLWDTSGGEREWTESAAIGIGKPLPEGRWVDGTSWRDPVWSIESLDRIDGLGAPYPANHFGIRLARAVPGAGCTSAVVCAILHLTRRRRRPHETASNHRLHSGSHVACGSGTG
ncbi:MAG: SUMF1/EgtB/PvdO family nonheme iron enzyme [Phycisphaerae bacterium]|nr:SUMF1/EgtB/PvdO family nonheme iron enzyme [Phycisphaerae bacterium]